MKYLLALTALLAAPGPVAKLVNLKGRPALQIDGRTLLLGQPDEKARAQSFAVFSKGKIVGQVDPYKEFLKWLEDDERWGGHERANQLRYMQKSAGGINIELSNLLDVKGVGSYAVMTLRYAGPSGEPTGPQVLLRLPNGQAKLEWVRRLGDIPATLYGPVPPRLFVFGNLMFTFEPDGIYTLRNDGSKGKFFANVPAEAVPLGLADRRYLVVASTPDLKSGERIETIDLASGNSKLILQNPAQKQDVFVPHLPAAGIGDSPYLLFDLPTDTNGGTTYFTLHLPDLARHNAPASVNPLGEFGIQQDRDEVVVYSLRNARPVQRIPLRR